ncbi:hypothetical protein HZC00_00875 [Candidatus Kaiserbacteria bacterium]|nr:hypothetical protein [Candidatus Kaiserbacteria bacterium]
MSWNIYKKKIAEGKTKIIYQSSKNPTEVRIKSKDAITAQNGARREVIPGKGRLVNSIACEQFDILGRHNVPSAFRCRCDEVSFIATRCEMVKLEIVVRFEIDAAGSYKKRNPNVPDGQRLKEPLVELFLKTSQRKWGLRDLPCDDPLIREAQYGRYEVYQPDIPLRDQMPLFEITTDETGLRKESDMAVLHHLARAAGAAFYDAWASVGVRLIDFKMEVGYTPDGELVFADLMSPDECRMVTDISKQGFRTGDAPEVVYAKYVLADALLREVCSVL